MKIFTFSVKPSEHKMIHKIARIKLHCMKTGISFSSIVIKALENYKIKGIDEDV